MLGRDKGNQFEVRDGQKESIAQRQRLAMCIRSLNVCVCVMVCVCVCNFSSFAFGAAGVGEWQRL